MPVGYIPRFYGFASWLLLVFIIGYIFSARFSFGNGLKFLLGLSLVATTAHNEVFFNLANWAFITSLIWLLLSISNEPRSLRDSFFDIVLLILAGLNSPFVICLWPIFLLRWYARRTPHSVGLLVISLTVAVIQVWNMPPRVIEEGSLLLKPGRLLVDVLIYRFGFMFLGEQVYQIQLTDPLRIYGLIIVSAFYGGLIWYAIRKKNWPLLTILAGGILAVMLSLYVMRNHLDAMVYFSGRHFYIPAVSTAWALLLADFKPGYLRWSPLTMIFVSFLFLTPENKNQVLPDLNWAGYTAKCVGTLPKCKIPINPVWDPPVWFAHMDSHVFRTPAIKNPFSSRFGEQIELLGYDVSQNHSVLHLKLVWHALGTIKTDYKFFVHLFSPNNPTQILAQIDQTPLEGRYPTSKWLAKEFIIEKVELSLAKLSPGEYQMGLGWYDPNSPKTDRLAAYDESHQRSWEDNRVILPIKVVIP